MNIGWLRYHIAVQQRADTENPEGMVQEAWSDLMTIWADMGLAGKYIDQEAFGKTSVGAMRKMICRINSQLQEGQRVIYDNKTYEIINIDKLRDRYECMISQVV